MDLPDGRGTAGALRDDAEHLDVVESGPDRPLLPAEDRAHGRDDAARRRGQPARVQRAGAAPRGGGASRRRPPGAAAPRTAPMPVPTRSRPDRPARRGRCSRPRATRRRRPTSQGCRTGPSRPRRQRRSTSSARTRPARWSRRRRPGCRGVRGPPVIDGRGRRDGVDREPLGRLGPLGAERGDLGHPERVLAVGERGQRDLLGRARALLGRLGRRRPASRPRRTAARSPLHVNVGVAERVGPDGPPVMSGAAEGGVGSMVNVRAAGVARVAGVVEEPDEPGDRCGLRQRRSSGRCGSTCTALPAARAMSCSADPAPARIDLEAVVARGRVGQVRPTGRPAPPPRAPRSTGWRWPGAGAPLSKSKARRGPPSG